MSSDAMRSILSVAILAFVAAILWMMNNGLIAETMRDLALIVVGAILSKFTGVYDFYFGSSDGSKRKTELSAPQEESTLDLTGAEIDR